MGEYMMGSNYRLLFPPLLHLRAVLLHLITPIGVNPSVFGGLLRGLTLMRLHVHRVRTHRLPPVPRLVPPGVRFGGSEYHEAVLSGQ